MSQWRRIRENPGDSGRSCLENYRSESAPELRFKMPVSQFKSVFSRSLMLIVVGVACTDGGNCAECSKTEREAVSAELMKLSQESVRRPSSAGSTGGYDAYLNLKARAYSHLQFNELAKAETDYQEIVKLCRNSKNYLDLGAEWDERRRQGVPTAKPFFVHGVGGGFVDSRRPGLQFNRKDLLNSLIMLAAIQERQGKKAEGAETLEEARNLFDALASHSGPQESFVTLQADVVRSDFPISKDDRR